jgi:hypothetical protein
VSQAFSTSRYPDRRDITELHRSIGDDRGILSARITVEENDESQACSSLGLVPLLAGAGFVSAIYTTFFIWPVLAVGTALGRIPQGLSRQVSQFAVVTDERDARSHPTSNAADGIFSDSLASELVTPTSDAAGGYSASFQVGISL